MISAMPWPRKVSPQSVEILALEIVRQRLCGRHLAPDTGVKHAAADAHHGEIEEAEARLPRLIEMLLQVVPLSGKPKVAAPLAGGPHARAPDGIAIEIEIDRGEPQPLGSSAGIGCREQFAAGVARAGRGSGTGFERHVVTHSGSAGPAVRLSRSIAGAGAAADERATAKVPAALAEPRTNPRRDSMLRAFRLGAEGYSPEIAPASWRAATRTAGAHSPSASHDFSRGGQGCLDIYRCPAAFL